MPEHNDAIRQLAKEFKSCQKILLALGDESRQHIILEMLKMGHCYGARVGSIFDADTDAMNSLLQMIGHAKAIMESLPDRSGEPMIESEKVQLFEKTPIPKAVVTLAVLTICSSLVTVLYNMADTYFVGMLNDPVQNAAVTLAAPVLLAFSAVNNLFGVGSSSMMSRAMGKKITIQWSGALPLAFTAHFFAGFFAFSAVFGLSYALSSYSRGGHREHSRNRRISEVDDRLWSGAGNTKRGYGIPCAFRRDSHFMPASVR